MLSGKVEGIVKMSAHNKVRTLGFSGPYIEGKFVQNVKNYPIQGRTIVINADTSEAYGSETPRTRIPAFSSTILANTQIEQAVSLILLEVKETPNRGSIILEQGWDLYGRIIGSAPSQSSPAAIPFPTNTPLWRSPQEEVDSIEFDPSVVLGQATVPKEIKRFSIKVNLGTVRK